MIADTITQKIGEAMKARDEIRLSTLRLLSSALNYEKIAKQHDLSEDEELAVVRREAKKRKDAIEALRQAQGKLTPSGTDQSVRIEREQKELVILQEYLPAEMSDEELEKIIQDSINQLKPQGMQDMGRVIGVVMGKVKGLADGGRVAEQVKEKLDQ